MTYFPRKDVLLKMMRACIGVKTEDNLWFVEKTKVKKVSDSEVVQANADGAAGPPAQDEGAEEEEKLESDQVKNEEIKKGGESNESNEKME